MTAVVDGGVTAPLGYVAAGVAAGIKRQPGALDVALVVSESPAQAAALFTTNLATAAPVVVSREHLAGTGGRARAVVVNSGCANACTGASGLEVARRMCTVTARAIGCPTEEVLVASTGVIGVPLDPDIVTAGIAAAAGQLSRAGHDAAARAILTTDRGPKTHAVRVELSRGAVVIGGMAKGAGMIEPRLATMLAFLTTDAQVEASRLQAALAEACEDTFNAITIDGECSTNDSVFLLANGASGVAVTAHDHAAFVAALREVALVLATAIVRGGEGATKLVTVRVVGAATPDCAHRAARAIANSLLVKTAIHGGDPNWGRLVAVAGRSGARFDLARAGVRIGDVVLFEAGQPFDERAPLAAARLQAPDVEVTVDLGTGGPHAARMFTCDLSADYVRINADYRT